MFIHKSSIMKGSFNIGIIEKILRLKFLSLIVILNLNTSIAWLPDTTTKLINNYGQIHTYNFTGNNTYPDHFIILNQDNDSILLGGRNRIYNLSIYDFSERKESRIEWPSSDAHSQLCSLKGKTEDDCQNYVRILVSTAPGKLLICGTNSYKPLCRYYTKLSEGRYVIEKEIEGIGLCPYNPDHNSTAVYSNGQLFSATVADFSGTDPLIYREPQRTELSDLKQLNAPNFVSSVPYGDYIFFFYRETAVEYINCGKVIYSRVARVCRDDKGGPHQFRDRWTTFLKARLNCSVPGEYPFYFDEIQSTSDIIKGNYGNDDATHVIYTTSTTPTNAIGGSAICVYSMKDVLRVFEGSFKQQENINSNWLPVPKEKVPEPRPGQCVRDSRILQENNVNFVKTHSLMEDAVPALFGRPILIRVSLQYRFTAIAVDPQVHSLTDEYYDVLYVGTDDGKVLKVVNIPTETTAKAVVISENAILPNGAPIKQIKVVPGYGNVVVVGRDEVKLANLNHCSNIFRCSECVSLQDPHCAWDVLQRTCVSVDVATRTSSLIQDVSKGDSRKCRISTTENKKILNKEYDVVGDKEITDNRIDGDILNTVEKTNINEVNCEDGINEDNVLGCSVRQRLVIYTAETLHLVVIGASLAGLFLGFIAGYLFSRRFHPPPQYPDAPFIEQHNHLDRLSGNQNGFLTPRANKAVNLVVNVPSNSPPPKKDNLDASKDLNIASDGTLQKIKKTYI